MAKLSSDGTYVTVESGDCLTQIAVDYCGSYSKYKDLAKLNNISNPNVILVGQKIYLAGKAGSSSSKPSTSNKNKSMINYFGLMSQSSNPTLYAGWTNPKPSKETEHFAYRWEYTIADTGVGSVTNADAAKRWTISDGTTTEWECTCTIPENAEIVYFKVKPVSKTYRVTEGDKEVEKTYWTCSWTNMNGEGAYKPFNTSKSLPPDQPSAPSIALDNQDKYDLVISHSSLDVDKLGGKQVEFQVVKDNKSLLSTSSKIKVNATTHYASFRLDNVAAGAEYKARCRLYNGGVVGEWSDYSGSVTTPPPRPKTFTQCYTVTSPSDGKTSVYLKWGKVSSAATYDIEYATDPAKFDLSDQTHTVTGITTTQRILDSLEPGYTYYFRLRAVSKDGGESPWSEVTSTVFGETPGAPTTWSSSTSASVGGPLNLYWVHNSKDGSSQTWAELELAVYTSSTNSSGGIQYTQKWSKYIHIENTADFDERDKTSSFDATECLQDEIPSLYKDGIQLRWRARTAGVTNTLGEWSIIRTVDIYALPTVSVSLRDATGTINTSYDTLGSFPIYVSTATLPVTQNPIGFFLSISSRDVYETVDNAGNDKMVNAGEEVYSRYFNQNTDLTDIKLAASDVNLETNVRYTLTCVASMDSGLTAETSVNLTVSWEDVAYTPNAAITYDREKAQTQIRPFCELYETTFKKVVYDSATDTYLSTGDDISVVEGSPLVRMYTKSNYEVFSELSVSGDLFYYYYNKAGTMIQIPESQIHRRVDIYTTTGERVYLGCTEITISANGTVTGGEDVYYYEFEKGTLVEGVTLSVYRREFDGSYTELGSNIDNTKNTHIIDPHPALDYARYRIVATTNATGAVSFYDVPGYPIGEKSVIIQWDEDWSYFDADVDDPPAQPPWSGSMLRLPYNIDVSDSYDMDVALVSYTGRKRPVTYYGTQLGESSSWSVVIPKDDKETLYALRRLAVWPGDAYVREPSGTGYWANVSVSFSQTHNSVTIPVSLSIKRVEGGA